jgi:hypothetical protein
VRTLLAGSPEALIIIGHDQCVGPIDRAILPPSGDIRVRPRDEPVRRGEFSCLEPYLEAAAALRDADEQFDWLVYLSGQDYPVRPVSEIERTFATGDVDGFVRYWDVLSPDSPWGTKRAIRRYFYRWRRLPDWFRLPLRLVKAFRYVLPIETSFVYGVHLGTRLREPPFDDRFRCFGGSQWQSLSRPAVEVLVDSLRERPDLVDYFRQCLVPDEALVQTVLINSGRLRLANDNRRFTDTEEREKGHARVLVTDDFDRLTDGSFDFARKFDPVLSRELLDRLDAVVHAQA